MSAAAKDSPQNAPPNTSKVVGLQAFPKDAHKRRPKNKSTPQQDPRLPTGHRKVRDGPPPKQPDSEVDVPCSNCGEKHEPSECPHQWRIIGDQLLRAAEQGDTEECRRLIASMPANIVNYQNADGVCSLHIAAGRRPEDALLVLALLELGADPCVRDCRGAQAKDYASRASNETSRKIISNRMNLFITLPEDDELLRVLGAGTWKHQRTVMMKTCRLFRRAIKAGTAQHRFRGFGIDFSSASSRKVFKQPGTEAGKIGCARGIAVDAAGEIYVAEQDTRRVQVFNQEGQLVRTYGGEGLAGGKFMINGAFSVHVDEKQALVYCAAPGNHVVNVYRLSGGYKKVIGKGILATPQGVTTTPAGEIVVADAGLKQLVNGWPVNGKVYDVTMASARVAAVTLTEQLNVLGVNVDTGDTWIAATLPACDLTGGRGVAIDRDQNLLVTTQDSKKVYAFSPEFDQSDDATTWKLWRQFELKDYSYGIAVHPGLGVFTCGYNEARIDRLDNFDT